MKVNKAGIETLIEVIWMEGIESWMVNQIELLTVGAESCDIIIEWSDGIEWRNLYGMKAVAS